MPENYIVDSRSLVNPESAIFVSIKTKTGDGHRYIREMVNKGVGNFIVSNKADKDYLDSIGLKATLVDDGVEELRSRAADRRESFKGEVIAVTGSRGKTLVKEWLNILLGAGTSRSPRSYNSRLGVPLSILNHSSVNDENWILEVGISRKGEMLLQEEMVKPTVVILTNVNEEHDNGFSSLGEKIEEKLLLAKNARVLIYNRNDREINERVKKFKEEVNPGLRLVSWKNTGDRIQILEEEPGEDKILFSFDGNETGKRLSNSFDRENLYLAIASAVFIEGRKSDELIKLASDVPGLITRINVLEGLNDSKIFVDRFTTDALSMTQVFDFVRRSTPANAGITAIFSHDRLHSVSDPHDVYHKIFNIGRLYNVSRFILIGADLKKDSFAEHTDVEVYGSIAGFIAESRKKISGSYIIHSEVNNSTLTALLSYFEAKLHETTLEINLDALLDNYRFFKSKLKSDTGMICMLKAFGYGTGSVQLAKVLESQGVEALAVAVVDEGIELRNHGIECPVMILNPRGYSYHPMIKARLEPVVYNFRMLEDIIGELKGMDGGSYPIHIKLETGMRRIGFTSAELPVLVEVLSKNIETVRVKSVFSHLATADCPDMDDYTHSQIDLFRFLSSRLENGLGYGFKRHILNTAGILRFPEAQMDCVRLGIGLYGVPTLPGEKALRNVATFTTTIISLKKWNKGDSIGYGGKNRLERDSLIATVPVGYADGIDRRLGRGNGFMTVKGHRCPTVGNICMDICMLDVTDVPDCAIGNRVEIFGNNLDIAEISRQLDTIPYEVLTSVSHRVKRIYYRE